MEEEDKKSSISNSGSSSSNNSESIIHSTKIKEQLATLKSQLEARKERHVLDDETTKARNSVLQCLKDNASKPLKCYDEVEKFKAKVKDYEKSIL